MREEDSRSAVMKESKKDASTKAKANEGNGSVYPM